MTAKPNGPAYPPGARLLANVTRLEVIDDTGRALTYPAGEPMEVELSFQDDDRTLKVFVRGRGHDYGPMTGKWRRLTGDNLPPRDRPIELWDPSAPVEQRASVACWAADSGDPEYGWNVSDCLVFSAMSTRDLFQRYTHWSIVEGPEK